MSTTEDVPKAGPICKPNRYSLLLRANLNALPDELLLEVLSHFPSDPIAFSNEARTQSNRRETLLSLSAVCQDFRRVFRPCLWQRVEVCTGMQVGKKWLSHIVGHEDFGKEILRQLNVVTVQDSGLAQYVRIVDIEVNEATIRPVFVELGRCFSLFPNLHTVRIVSRAYFEKTIAAAAKRGFKKTIPYPQIRLAILSPSVYPLIAACPNLESLTTWETASFRLPAFINGVSALRTPSCSFFRVIVPFLFAATRKATRENLPSLRQMTIWLNYALYEGDHEAIGKIIRLFSNVRTLVLQNGLNNNHKLNWNSRLIKSWKQGLLDLSPHDRQNLKEVIFSGITGQEIVVLPEV